MPRDYNSDDGGYSGPMQIADIFADSVRQTIESRRAAETQNLAVMANQQNNDLRVKELAQRKELAEAEMAQRSKLQGDELTLRREDFSNRMATNAAELELKRQELAARKLEIEARSLGTSTQRAKAESVMNNIRMASGLLGGADGSRSDIAYPGTGPIRPQDLRPAAAGGDDDPPTVPSDAPYGTGYEDADVTSPSSKALKGLNASWQAGMNGQPMPGATASPAANDPTLPSSPGAGPISPDTLLSPPENGAEGSAGPPGPAAPSAEAPLLPPPVLLSEEEAAYRTQLRRVMAMQKLAKDPHTPIDYQIKLEEEVQRIQSDPAFAGQVKAHAARLKLAEDRQVLPTTIFASPADKQIAFSKTYPHLNFAVTPPGDDFPQIVRPDGSQIPDAEFKVIKSAWDQFEYKPGQLYAPSTGVSPFAPPRAASVPVQPPLAAPPAAALSLAQRKAAETNAPLFKQWDEFKANAFSDIPKAFKDEEIPSVEQSIRLGERDVLAAALLKKGSSLVEEKEVPVRGRYAMGGMGGGLVGGAGPSSEKKIVFKQIKAPNGQMMDAFDVLKLSVGEGPAAAANEVKVSPEQQSSEAALRAKAGLPPRT